MFSCITTSRLLQYRRILDTTILLVHSSSTTKYSVVDLDCCGLSPPPDNMQLLPAQYQLHAELSNSMSLAILKIWENTRALVVDTETTG